MFCTSSREKGPLPASVHPQDLRCVARGVDWLTLEFELVLPQDPDFSRDAVECHVERMNDGLFSSWKPVHDAVFEDKSGASQPSSQAATPSDRHGGSKRTTCAYVVPNLAHECGFTFRVLARGGPDQELSSSSACVCRTASRPSAAGASPTLVARRAHALCLEWGALDPEGAPVEECEVQTRCDSVVSGWRAACGRLAPCGQLGPDGVRLWQGSIGGLEGASAYRLRVRARNAVGWSPDFSPELLCWTSDLPLAPKELRCAERNPHSVVVHFAIGDPEGAPVRECTVDLCGALGFHSFSYCRFESVLQADDADSPVAQDQVRRASCTLEGLQPETTYTFRFWARNDAGSCRLPSSTVECRTSDRPDSPAEVRVKPTGPTSFLVEFDACDPEGAPVDRCQLEFSRDSMFASWTAVDAECIGPAWQCLPSREHALEPRAQPAMAVPDAPMKLQLPELLEPRLTSPFTAPEVEEATPAAPCPFGLRRYRVVLERLDRETAYLFRARARSCIGWSTLYSPTVFARATDLPPTPKEVRCVARLPAAIRLEFLTTEIPDTAPISSVHMEDGTLSWQEVPIHAMEKHAVADSEPGTTAWSVQVHLGVGPTVMHTLRVWTQSSAGRCREPSAVCLCRTSDQPDAPAEVAVATCSAHCVQLEWFLPDPEGAPVWQCEVQYSENSSLSSWRAAACADLQRTEGEEQRWRCSVDRLKPATSYLLRVRARNEVGWSDWDRGNRAAVPTSGTPQAARSLTARPAALPSASSRASAEAAGCGGLAVTVVLDEPEDAPLVTCVVTWVHHGRRVPCQRLSPGLWLALFQQGEQALDAARDAYGRLTFNVSAANAVGWGGSAELMATDAESPSASSTSSPSSGVRATPVVEEAERALRERRAACGRIAAQLEGALARGDDEHVAWLSVHRAEQQRRVEALEEVARQMEEAAAPSPRREGSKKGSQLVARLQCAVRQHRLIPDLAAATEVLCLLLRGCMWLEATWCDELGPFSPAVEELMCSVPNSGGRMLQHWIKQHHVWSEGFDRKVCLALPESLACCAQVLAALAGGGDISPLESARGVAEALLELLSAAERQLRRLRQTRRVLELAQGASSHNFEPPSVGEKIETTALSLLTTTVLAVALPGATECGVARIGMLWLEGKGAGSHLALEHPTGAPIQPLLERLGWTPPSTAGVILSGWAGGGHSGVVLVHNLAARRITIAVRPDEDTFASRINQKLSNAHPMVSAISQGLSDPDAEAPAVTILPTDVGLIQVPDSSTSTGPDGEPAEKEPVRLIFSYGPASSPEKDMGWARVRPGSALSFICLDSGLQVCNREGCEGEALGLIEVVNNDLATVNLNVLRAAESRKMFEKAIASETLQPGELRELKLPQSGLGRVFEVEVCYSDGSKARCEVRPGQRVSVERYV